MKQIKTLSEPDMAASALLIRRSFAGVAARFGLTRHNCPGNGAFISEQALLRELARGTAMFGLFTDEELRGFVAAKPDRGNRRPAAAVAGPCPSAPCARPPCVWYLEKLAVPPAYRESGCGTALLAHALAHMRGSGATRVRIGVIADNLPLIAWYERRGFTRTQTRDFASLPFTVQYMERPL